MIQYGAPPAEDEIEVTVFGPGYGEAIAVHLGDHNWMLVDSCIDPHSRGPASLSYLKSIDVAPENVRVIVASHWHDDHVRGISDIARACPGAEFQISGVFNNKESLAFLAAYGGGFLPALTSGTKELYAVLSERESIFQLQERAGIFDYARNGHRISVCAISPLQSAKDLCIANLAQHLPEAGAPITKVVPLRPNHESVAIHIDFGQDGGVLLGSDLEDHPSYGWTAIAENGNWWRLRPKASAYKVAHHGSASGDSPVIWTALLQTDSYAALTPFNQGRHALPTDRDKERLKSCTRHAYSASGASRKAQLDPHALRRIGTITGARPVRPVNNGFGAVRLRKRFGEASWRVEIFGDACAL